MTATERCIKIMEILEKKKIIATRELESLLFSSPSTIRRDLIILEKQKRIIREHGEVKLVPSKNMDYSYNSRLDERVESKELIAEMASNFLGQSQAIFLDSSSTTSFIMPYLAGVDNLQVITNSVYLPPHLNNFPNVSLFVTGGEVTPGTNSILGNFAVDFLDNFRTDIAIFSCRGIDSGGTYEADYNQALFKRKMIANSKKNILLVDSSKFDSKHFFKLTYLDKIDHIITDKKPSNNFINTIDKRCEVIWPDSDLD